MGVNRDQLDMFQEELDEEYEKEILRLMDRTTDSLKRVGFETLRPVSPSDKSVG